MRDKYTRLKIKMVLELAGVTLLTAVLGVLLVHIVVDGIFQAPFADIFVGFCRNILGISEEFAISLYRNIFQQNKSFFLVLGFLFLLAIAVYLAMSRISRYMNLISEGLDEVLDDGGRPISLPQELKPMENRLNMLRDRLRRREYEAKEAEQRKNDLVVYLAHDLKTPLTSVIGYLSLLNDEKEISPALREKYTGIALDKAERLEGLIDEFFEITRFNLQGIELERSLVNLTRLLNQLADEFYPVFAESKLTCELEIPQGLEVLGDADKLARVFDNLLRNAVHYSPEEAKLAVSARRDGAQVDVFFRNTGARIPQQQLERIFEKFYRLDFARSSRTGGAGLGLAIAKEIVELHGGTIAASSRDAYTEFRVTLPAAPDATHTTTLKKEQFNQ